MDENQKLVQDFGRAIAEFMLARARGSVSTSERQAEVNRLELEILSRMKVKEPL